MITVRLVTTNTGRKLANVRFRILFVALFFVAHPAWALVYDYTSPVTIDHTKVPSTQTDFPVLVSITDARFKDVAHSGHVQNTSGYDIRPFSDTGCQFPLTFELERYNGSTGEVVMWVKISSLSSSSDTVIYLGYGNSSINTDGSSASTWSNGFLGVYHLKDGTTLNVNSATGSNNGTNHSATAVAGQIDGAGGFVSASTQYIDLSTGIAPGKITLSAWVKATSFPNAYNGVIVRSNAAYTSYAMLFVNSGGKLSCYAYRSGGSAGLNYDGTGSHTLSSGTWYYLTMTYTGDTSGVLTGYVNAASDATTGSTLADLAITAGTTHIGNDTNTVSRGWNGTLDEARVSSVDRSANWITTEYNNQNDPSTFETLGTEVNGPCPTPTPTATFTPTPTATATSTFTPTATATFTPTATATFTPTATATFTPTPTPTPTPAATATATATTTPVNPCRTPTTIGPNKAVTTIGPCKPTPTPTP